MKKQYALLLAASMFAFGFGLNNFAMSSVNQKIAVVDVNQVVTKSAQVQALKKEQTKKMEDLQKWVKTVKSDVEKQKTQEGKIKLAQKYDGELIKKREAIAKDYQAKLQKIDKSISDTIVNQAKASGYDVVLTKSVVLYGGDDITAAIAKAVK